MASVGLYHRLHEPVMGTAVTSHVSAFAFPLSVSREWSLGTSVSAASLSFAFSVLRKPLCMVRDSNDR